MGSSSSSPARAAQRSARIQRCDRALAPTFQCHQIVRRGAGAEGRVIRPAGRRGACVARREWRGQIHAHQSHHRRAPARRQARLQVAGQHVRHLTPAAARSLGIACIYQQPALFPDLTVAENIALRLEHRCRRPPRQLARAPRPRGATPPAHRREDFARCRSPLAFNAGAAARRNRLRARCRRPHRHHGRADRIADAEGSGSCFLASCAASVPAAWASSTSPIAWKRFSLSPTA